MQINWITVGIVIIIILIAYAGYKVLQIMRDIKRLKENLVDQPDKPLLCKNPQMLQISQPPVQPIQPAQCPIQQPSQMAMMRSPHPQVLVAQPKLTPPTLHFSNMNKVPVREEYTETESDLDSNSDTDSKSNYQDKDEHVETDVFNLNESEMHTFDYKSNSEMIIPLDLNSIIKQVVADKINEESNHNKTSIIEIKENTLENNQTLIKDLNKKTINELKELARVHNIRLYDGGKPKNKETLLKELSNI